LKHKNSCKANLTGFAQVVVTGKANDGGIDGHGTLMVSPLVSFRVLFQCKRHSNAIGSPEVRNFRGAMAGRADKGIFITTSTFTAEAIREASRDGVHPIELIDGERLVDLMEKLELGLKPVRTFVIDIEFFKEFAI
jgi:restriction system protein